MEIRCEQCEFLGAAAEVRPTDGGVGLVCAGCGYVNLIAADGAQDTQGRDGVAKPMGEVGAGDAQEEQKQQRMGAVVDRLLPKPGEGRRCPKCLNLVGEEANHCSACGLDLGRAFEFDVGEAPWEQPPSGKEEQAAQARRIWDEALAGGERGFEEFAEFCVEEDLIDLGIRWLQGHLVDARDDQAARDALGRLAKSLEASIFMARSRAEAQGEQFQETIKRARSRLLLGALIFWTLILLLFSWLFWDKF